MASTVIARAMTSRCVVRRFISSLRRSSTQAEDSKTDDKPQTKSKAKQFADCPSRVFSGIQPTGIPHLGNYVGAIRNWVDLQHQYHSMLLCVVDLHAITVPQDPQLLRQNIRDMAACLIACGIDSEKAILFRQSEVLQHTQLSWLLGCQCTPPRLRHLPQWKEKSEKFEDPGLGLFTYPVLQAADILLYKATAVPVGTDQIHHIELTRHLAKTFNRKHSLLFPHCEALIGDVAKIRSLTNPDSKMSKSEANPLSRIELTDTPDQIAEKIKKAVTDSLSEVTYDPENRPGVSNLVDIHMGLSGLSPEEICGKALMNGQDPEMFKSTVTEVVVEKLKPISDTIRRLQGDPGYLEHVLKRGAERAEAIAEHTMSEVNQAVGVSSSPVRPSHLLHSTTPQAAATTQKHLVAEYPLRVFSGIQPTGIPHLGNYLGAIRNGVKLQHKYPSMFGIADLHAITVPQDPQQLRQNILDMAACLIACGVEPEKTILFQQSQVLQHSLLSWALACLCPLSPLERRHEWQEKSEKLKDPGLGLFTYPVLQAADILLYKATHVPVGEDQIGNVELACDLTKMFNQQYGPVFPDCKPVTGDFTKIRSLTNPDTKMSRSEINPLSRIELTDTPDQIAKKIKKAVTDFTSEVTYDPENRPGVSNLINIHMGLSGLFPEDICEDAFLKAQDTGMFKSTVTEVVVEKLKPISDNIRRLQGDPAYLEQVLKTGSEQAEAIAEQTMREVLQALGLD